MLGTASPPYYLSISAYLVQWRPSCEPTTPKANLPKFDTHSV